MIEEMMQVGAVLSTVYAGYKLVRWIKGLLLYRSFVKFTDKYLPTQSETIRKAVAVNAQFMAEIEQYLKDRGVCDHVEYIGSTYEGLNIDENDNIRLKTLMIIPVSRFDIAIENIRDMPGYAWLRFMHGRQSSPFFDRVLSYWNILGIVIGTRYLDAPKTVGVFKRELKKCITESKQMTGKIKVRRIGPILHMEVYPDSWLLSWGSRLYSVDIIPAYEIGNELFESRPIEGDEMPNDMTWHRSFAVQERKKLCEGSKKVLRVLKVLHKRESDFNDFTSYQLKTVVFHEMDVNHDWTETMLGRRLADVLARLEKCLTARNLPHYFEPEINLLSKMPSYTMDYLRDRIERLRANEIEMRKLLLR